MIIQIELIVIAIIAFIFLAWSVWFRWSRRRLRKRQNKHDPDNEKYKTRSGGEDTERRTSEVGGGEPSLAEATDSVPRPTESGERELLPTATDDVSGKNVRRFGNALRRTRRTRS